MTKLKIKNALISLTDKNKIEIVAKKLKELDINIISTGGTAKYLKSHSIDVIDITEITNFPEILDGRVKSLHPKIFGGILYRRNNENDLKTIDSLKIESIDLVIVNLYKFDILISNKYFFIKFKNFLKYLKFFYEKIYHLVKKIS